jgi:hypothetical protein
LLNHICQGKGLTWARQQAIPILRKTHQLTNKLSKCASQPPRLY